MLAKAVIAVSLTIGGSLATPVAHADYIQNLGTYAGDVIAQLQDWGYNVMLNGLDRDIAYMDERQKRDCQVLGINPTVHEPLESGAFQTVFVSLSCPGNPSSSTPSV
jgi:hypothetical protein